ncbi:hypothetical protein AMTRI_Chr08g161170 [Amborella trichopoda]
MEQGKHAMFICPFIVIVVMLVCENEALLVWVIRFFFHDGKHLALLIWVSKICFTREHLASLLSVVLRSLKETLSLSCGSKDQSDFLENSVNCKYAWDFAKSSALLSFLLHQYMYCIMPCQSCKVGFELEK